MLMVQRCSVGRVWRRPLRPSVLESGCFVAAAGDMGWMGFRRQGLHGRVDCIRSRATRSNVVLSYQNLPTYKCTSCNLSLITLYTYGNMYSDPD